MQQGVQHYSSVTCNKCSSVSHKQFRGERWQNQSQFLLVNLTVFCWLQGNSVISMKTITLLIDPRFFFTNCSG